MAVIDANPSDLKEFRCKNCRKLLFKGFLTDPQSVLEIKCRGCGNICSFSGKEAENILVFNVSKKDRFSGLLMWLSDKTKRG